MTPFLADSVSHRVRLAWLVAALAAGIALRAGAAAPERSDDHARALGIGRCREARASNVASSGQRAQPAACVAYHDRLVRLAECEQLPLDGRRALREASQQLESWTSFPGEARDQLADGCRMATSALDEAAAALSCDIVTPRR